MTLRRILAGLLLVAGCKGNVNDDSVLTIAIELLSVSTGGTIGNNGGREPDVNGDGEFLVFESSSSNLDARDTNTITDIFRRNTLTGETELVSVNAAGTAGGNNFSNDPRISPDGRFVVWNSQSTNFTAFPDANGTSDIFCRDMDSGITVPVTVNSAGTSTGNSGSFDPADVIFDGTDVFVVFSSFASDLVPGVTGTQVYIRRIPDATFGTVATHTTALISESTAGGGVEGNNPSRNPVVGRDTALALVYVAFESNATDMHALDGTGGTDVFWRSISTSLAVLGPTSLVSVRSDGLQGGDSDSDRPALSTDGRFVAFESDATNLLPLSGDTNGVQDIFIRGDMTAAPATDRVSETAAGDELTSNSKDASISFDGEFVTFDTSDPNVVPGDSNGVADVFRKNTVTLAVDRVSLTLFGGEPNQNSTTSSISGDGRYVAFSSGASNIIPGSLFDTQVFGRRF